LPTVSPNAAAPRDELRNGATQIKILASGGVASTNDPIWNLQYSEEEVREIVEEAQAWHTYAMAHAYSLKAIRGSIDFGVRSVEHGNLIDRADGHRERQVSGQFEPFDCGRDVAAKGRHPASYPSRGVSQNCARFSRAASYFRTPAPLAAGFPRTSPYVIRTGRCGAWTPARACEGSEGGTSSYCIF
jgi:hypothetical protein